MDQDDGRRERLGVGVSLTRTKSGAPRLVMDDLELVDSGSQWKQSCFFTFIDVDEADAREHKLDDMTYATIGGALLARLLALYDSVDLP